MAPFSSCVIFVIVPLKQVFKLLFALTFKGEAAMAVLKHLVLYFTNRKETMALKEVFIRLHFYTEANKKDWVKGVHHKWKVRLN
jgi:hypothetical protein